MKPIKVKATYEGVEQRHIDEFSKGVLIFLVEGESSNVRLHEVEKILKRTKDLERERRMTRSCVAAKKKYGVTICACVGARACVLISHPLHHTHSLEKALIFNWCINLINEKDNKRYT